MTNQEAKEDEAMFNQTIQKGIYNGRSSPIVVPLTELSEKDESY